MVKLKDKIALLKISEEENIEEDLPELAESIYNNMTSIAYADAENINTKKKALEDGFNNNEVSFLVDTFIYNSF